MNPATTNSTQWSLLFSVFFACLCCCCQAHAWQDKVVGITDGHTITVLHEGKKERIRLYGIESPRARQDFGDKAKEFTSEAISRKVAEVEPVALDRKGRTKDQFGQTVALVYADGRKCLNEELVRAGLAWVHPDSCTRPECKAWKGLEKQAKRQKLGLWSLPNPIPPWEFRQNKGVHVPIYHGDIVKHVFHSSNCEDFDCSSCIAVFKGREQAMKAGYSPCGACNP
jgi:micrococcal nuclease